MTCSYTLPDKGRHIFVNLASLKKPVHDAINLLYYRHWTENRKYFYVYAIKRIMTKPF